MASFSVLMENRINMHIKSACVHLVGCLRTTTCLPVMSYELTNNTGTHTGIGISIKNMVEHCNHIQLFHYMMLSCLVVCQFNC